VSLALTRQVTLIGRRGVLVAAADAIAAVVPVLLLVLVLAAAVLGDKRGEHGGRFERSDDDMSSALIMELFD